MTDATTGTGGDERQTKACPYCGETILAVARKCKHCGEFLDGSAPPAAAPVQPIADAAAPAPPAAPAVAPPPKKKVGTVRLGISIVVLVALVGFGLYLYFVAGVAANVRVQCQVDGQGTGSCSFTNTGWGPGGACFRVTARNTKSGKVVVSGPVCSGAVSPSGGTTVSFSMQAPGSICGGVFTDWRKACDMDVTEVP